MFDALARLISTSGHALIDHAFLLSGGAAGLALLSEAMAVITPVRDRRIPWLAERLGVAPADIAPIGDGLLLWHEAAGFLEDRSTGALLPRGSPTLKGSYAVATDDRLAVICVHVPEDAILLTSDPDEDALRVLAGRRVASRPAPRPAAMMVEPAADGAARASLLEAVAAMDFGWRGQAQPILAVRGSADRQGFGTDAYTHGGRKVAALGLGETIPIADIAPKGQWASPEGRRAFLAHLRRQPRRGRSRAAILRRLAWIGVLVWLVASGTIAMPEDLGERLSEMAGTLRGGS